LLHDTIETEITAMSGINTRKLIATSSGPEHRL
jgi:hypothetical protein